MLIDDHWYSHCPQIQESGNTAGEDDIEDDKIFQFAFAVDTAVCSVWYANSYSPATDLLTIHC